MLALAGCRTVIVLMLDIDERVVSGDEDLEPLEEASCFGGLRARIPNEHVCPNADLLQPLDQCGVEREGQKPGRGLNGPEESIPALMAPLPRPLELISPGLPTCGTDPARSVASA